MAITVPVVGTEIGVTNFGKPVADEVNRLTTATTVSAWTNVTFQNSWTNQGAPYQLMQYRKIGDQVQLRGVIKPGSMNVPAFQLPAGHYATATTYATVLASSNTVVTLEINAAGQCSLFGPTAAYFAILLEYSTTT